MNTINSTAIETVAQPAKQVIYIHQEFQPEYNKAATAELNEQKLREQGKDVSGKFMRNLEKPVTEKQAKRTLMQDSRKASAGLDRLMAMESW